MVVLEEEVVVEACKVEFEFEAEMIWLFEEADAAMECESEVLREESFGGREGEGRTWT